MIAWKRNNQIEKTCLQCGDNFTMQMYNQKFCVEACRIEFFNNKKKEQYKPKKGKSNNRRSNHEKVSR